MLDKKTKWVYNLIRKKEKEEVRRMKITEREIRNYIENEKGSKVISIDMENGEFRYQPQGKTYDIKGFVENVSKWFDSLITIKGEKYHLANWWKEKNNIEWNLLQEGDLAIKSETEKAILITNNANTEVWIPKSVLSKIN